MDKCQNPPLLAYLEALPASYEIDQDEIIKYLMLSNDGSLFQSPSATASAFMITGNKQCMAYLRSLVQRCDNGGQKASLSLYPKTIHVWVKHFLNECKIIIN